MLSLSCLADRVSDILHEDKTYPLHENLCISIHCHSGRDSLSYSTISGDHSASPFEGTRLGVFIVIQSTLVQLASQWPAMATIPIVHSLQESMWVLHETNLMLCLEEGSLVVWSTSIDDVLSLCAKVSDEISLAKHTPSGYCAPDKQSVDAQTWIGYPLDQLNGLEGVGEPFIGGWSNPQDHMIVVYPSVPAEQEPELDFEPSFTNAVLLSSTPSLLTPIMPSPSLSTPPLSPSPQRSLGRGKYEADGITPSASFLHLPKDPNEFTPASSMLGVCLRDINYDHDMEAARFDNETEEADELVDETAFPQFELLSSMENCNLLSTPESLADVCLWESPSAKKSKTLADKTCTGQRVAESRSTRRSRRVATGSKPYSTTPKHAPSPVQLRGSSLPPLSPKTSASSTSDEDLPNDGDDSDDNSDQPRKVRKQQKRKKSAKKRFHCKFCSDSFTREADAERHSVKSCLENPDREGKKPCGYCGKGLPVRDDAKDRHWKSNSCIAAAHKRGIELGSLDFFSL